MKSPSSNVEKILRLCLSVCSINCEVLPYLHHIGKLTCRLLIAASATKQDQYPVNLEASINIYTVHKSNGFVVCTWFNYLRKQ